MKATFLLTSLFFASPLHSEEDYTFYLDQRNLVGDGFIRSTVEQEGTMTSAMAVPEGGSEFTLWTVANGTGAPVWTQIGTELVGAYLPSAELKITTLDPYPGVIPRTRVDQPFSLEIEVAGLDPENPEATEAAKRVLFDHRVAVTLLEGEVTNLNDGAEVQLLDQGFIEANGTETVSRLGSLPGENIYAEAGLESFSIRSMPDGTVAEKLLASAQVQIWPLATATISGLTADAVYAQIPTFSAQLHKLYPDSTTYFQVYSGQAVEGTVGQQLNSSVLVVNDVETRDGSLRGDISTIVQTEGYHTVEVVTVTPFGTDVLESVTFYYRPTISFRGSINGLK